MISFVKTLLITHLLNITDQEASETLWPGQTHAYNPQHLDSSLQLQAFSPGRSPTACRDSCKRTNTFVSYTTGKKYDIRQLCKTSRGNESISWQSCFCLICLTCSPAGCAVVNFTCAFLGWCACFCYNQVNVSVFLDVFVSEISLLLQDSLTHMMHLVRIALDVRHPKYLVAQLHVWIHALIDPASDLQFEHRCAISPSGRLRKAL